MVDVADVGRERILVHDEADDRGLGFMLSRISQRPAAIRRRSASSGPSTSRDPEHPEYGAAVTAQIAAAQARSGPGDLKDLLHSGATWTVD